MKKKKWIEPKVDNITFKKQISLGDCGKVSSSESGDWTTTCDPRWLAS